MDGSVFIPGLFTLTGIMLGGTIGAVIGVARQSRDRTIVLGVIVGIVIGYVVGGIAEPATIGSILSTP